MNESEFPTYQRLLVAKRLPGITKFIDDGGYFPNSIIINFNSKKNKFSLKLVQRQVIPTRVWDFKFLMVML